MVGTKTVLFIIDTMRQPRAMLSIVLTVWALWLPLFNSFDTTPTLREMAEVADELTWGLSLAGVGLSSFVLYLIDYFRKPPSHVRTMLGIIATSLVVTAWAIVCFSLAKANFASTATVIYSAITLFSLVNVLEVAGILEILRDRIDDLENR